MAKQPNKGQAGIFRPWDGKLTGPQPGDPNMPKADRSHSWSSVQKKQSQKTFTAEEVERIVQQAVEALKSGQPLPEIQKPAEEKEEQEEYTIGGK